MTITVIKKKTRKKNATDIQMKVESNSDFSYDRFDKQIIQISLLKELGIKEEQATEIADEVYKTLVKAEMTEVTTSVIRSIINVILLKKGYKEYLKYSGYTIPKYDLKCMTEVHNFENSNTGFGPESLNLLIAGNILKQYALDEVFDKEISTAHLKGDIHLHDLDFICRPYCSGNSIEYIKKYGLRLPNVSHSSPANHAQTLVNHIQCFASYLQGLFAGAIGWDAVNLFFAPLLVDMTYEQIKQVAQHLIFSFAQLAGNRGGQVVFTDFNLFLRVPEHYKNTPAIGPGGEYTGKNYSEYEKEMRLFLKALFEVVSAGDSNGGNFAFPKLLLHINENDYKQEDELLMLACEVNSKRGSVYILYDRGESIKVSQCCRLALTLTKEEAERTMKSPEEMRFSAWQNVTICLPNIAYQYKNIDDVYKEIDRRLHLALRAHTIKYNFICRLLDMKDKGMLAFLAKGFDGKPYLRREEAKFLIGIIGLNEMIQCLYGHEMHEDDKYLIKGLEIISYIYKRMNELSELYFINYEKDGKIVSDKITCLLEETPAEGLSLRSAKLDLKNYPEAFSYVKGDTLHCENVYYTNSVHLSYKAHVDIVERIEKQSLFSPMIQAGSIIHNWFGKSEPMPRALYKLYELILKETNAVQTADSPDMTVCYSCNTMSKGLNTECPKCGSKDVYNETRITGYFSHISGWTKSKLAELNDRVRIDEVKPSIPYTAIDGDKVKKEIIFFSKPNCEKCDYVKKVLNDLKEEDKKKVIIKSIGEADGLALALYYKVKLFPTIMLVENSKNVLLKIEQQGSFVKWLKENLSKI